MKIEISDDQIDQIVCTSLFDLIQTIEEDTEYLISTKDRKNLLKALKRVKLYYCGQHDQNLIKNKSCKNCTCGNHI
jgi:CRISPR/Cas system-associated exonuclease Cas4 (RecB family)